MRIIVRAVRERLEYVDYLRKHLPEAEFLFDSTGNAMATFLSAMIMAGDGPCLHMEEDIVLCRGFYHKAEAAIAERPKEVIQFFSMRKADKEIGSRYDYGRTFMMNQCFYLPAGYSRMIHDHYPKWQGKEENPTGFDLLIADWLKKRKEKYWIHVPSLVQHRQCRSLINPRRSMCRQSITFEDGLYE